MPAFSSSESSLCACVCKCSSQHLEQELSNSQSSRQYLLQSCIQLSQGFVKDFNVLSLRPIYVGTKYDGNRFRKILFGPLVNRSTVKNENGSATAAL